MAEKKHGVGTNTCRQNDKCFPGNHGKITRRTVQRLPKLDKKTPQSTCNIHAGLIQIKHRKAIGQGKKLQIYLSKCFRTSKTTDLQL